MPYFRFKRRLEILRFVATFSLYIDLLFIFPFLALIFVFRSALLNLA